MWYISKPKLDRFCIFLATALAAASANATKTNGRLEAGGIISTERFKDESGGSDKNDAMNYSFRSYYDVSDIGSNRYDFKWDIRDKYDLFDKLNKEKLQLDPANAMQVHQLNFTKPVLGSKGIGYTIGRIPVMEAGGVFTDGAEMAGKFSANWNSGLFGGLDPKQPGQTHLEFNKDTASYGGFLTYQARPDRWERAFSLTHALVTQSAKSDVDRRYLFHNMSYQWGNDSRLITMAYLDFVPRTYLQTGSLFYQQGFTRRFYTKLTLLGVDVIQYLRIQDVREELAASPYRQGTLKLDYRLSPLSTIEAGYLTGKRSIDGLTKKEYTLSLVSLKSLGPKWDTRAVVGHRDNFVSRDQFGRLGIDYYSMKWESNLVLEYGIERYTRTDLIKHPLVTELSLAHFFGRALYGTLSFQRAADEQVTILTTFFKLGYRFGSGEIAPLRDDSPARGAL